MGFTEQQVGFTYMGIARNCWEGCFDNCHGGQTRDYIDDNLLTSATENEMTSRVGEEEEGANCSLFHEIRLIMNLYILAGKHVFYSLALTQWSHR